MSINVYLGRPPEKARLWMLNDYYEKHYLCFTSQSDGATIRLDGPGSGVVNLEYVVLNSDYSVREEGTYSWSGNTGYEITQLGIGDKVCFRAS